jgi:hypothetical protein
MAKDPLNALGQRLGRVIPLVLILTLGHNIFSVYGDPALEWVNVFSGNATLYGEPVPEGAVVTAHDPQGVQCGMVTVKEGMEGSFELLPCYGDVPGTPEDEGLEPGERISFRVNGLPAIAEPISLNFVPVDPSTPITWTSLGDVWEVRLRAPAPVGGYSMPARWWTISRGWGGLLPTVGLGVAVLALAAVALIRKRR